MSGTAGTIEAGRAALSSTSSLVAGRPSAGDGRSMSLMSGHCADSPAGGSGVRITYYRLDGAPQVPGVSVVVAPPSSGGYGNR